MAKAPDMTADELDGALGILPRAPYAYTPTPLEGVLVLAKLLVPHAY